MAGSGPKDGIAQRGAVKSDAVMVSSTKLDAVRVSWTKLGAVRVSWTKLDAVRVSWTKLDAVRVSWTNLDAVRVSWTNLDAVRVSWTKLDAVRVSWTKCSWPSDLSLIGLQIETVCVKVLQLCGSFMAGFQTSTLTVIMVWGWEILDIISPL